MSWSTDFRAATVSGTDDWAVMIADQDGTHYSEFMGFQIVQIPAIGSAARRA